MVKTFDPIPQDDIHLSGDQVSGGTIADFSSTGISDQATKTTLVVTDGNIKVDSITVPTVTGDTTIKGDVKIYGILDAGMVRTTELIANQRYEKQFLEFATPDGSETAGRGLLWLGAKTRQMTFMMGPDRFWFTENIDLPSEKSYLVDGVPTLSRDTLGLNVVNSNLQSLGTLKGLEVNGEVNIDDHIFYNPVSQRLSLGQESGNGLFSVFDYINNVEVILDSNDQGHGVIGTYTTKSLDIVTDDQTRLSISETGNVTIGSEYKDSTVTRVYGKLAVGVKNPTEQLEVAGNVKFGNRLFANGSTAPTEGTYQTGDIVWNSTPKIDGYVGWVCIVGGLPGQWQPFGKIEP
jgi:hypothetical protein